MMREWIYVVAALAGLVLPYIVPHPFRFYFGVCFVLTLTALMFGRAGFDRIGLSISRREGVKSLIFFIVVATTARMVIPIVIGALGYRYVPHKAIGSQLNPLFQSLNDEMVFRALLLGGMATRLGAWRANLLTATLLTVAHEVYYVHFFHTSLAWTALGSIFITMWVCNFVFLKARHIGYAYAIHAGWNLTRFGGRIHLNDSVIPEGMTFNLVEASPAVFGLTLLLLVVVLCMFGREKNSTLRRSSDRN